MAIIVQYFMVIASGRIPRSFNIYIILFTALLLSVSNSTKIPYNDWVWYTHHFNYIYNNGFFAYFELSHLPYGFLGPLRGVRPSSTEPIVYVTAWIVGAVFGNNIAVYGFFFSFIFYLFFGFSSLYLARIFNLKGYSVTILVVFTLLVAPNFSIVIHLVRQEMGSAFAMAAIAAHLSRRNLLAILLSVIAVLSHNSLIFPLSIYAFGYYLPHFARGLFYKFVLLFIFVIFIRFIATASGRVDLDGDDGGVSTFTILMDLSVFFIFFVSKMRGKWSQLDLSIFWSVVTFYMLIVSFYGISILSLRLYFFVDIFTVLAFASALSSIKLDRYGAPLALVVLTLGWIYTGLSLMRSPFSFGWDLGDVFLWPLL